MIQPPLPLVHTRSTARTRTARAGCSVCHGTRAHWTTANAQALAAQHHDRTGHSTWCEIAQTIRYGTAGADPRQTDLEDAIAASSLGGEPEATPLTDLDASPPVRADVSAPKAALSKRALAAAMPEPTHA